jgi:hypothetical protein
VKIRYLSDVHIEFADAPAFLPSIGEDLVVLAGDVGPGLQGINWAADAFRGRPVVYVMGNHEFYHREYETTLALARGAAAKSDNVHLLERDYIDINGFRIAGCTLWTDFECFGPDMIETAMWEAQLGLSDYRLIKYRGDLLNPDMTRKFCLTSKRWLDDVISTSPSPLIVVTHHAPTMHTFNPRIKPDLLTGCFHNDRPELVRDPVRLWVHGHNHWSHTKIVNGLPIVSNQRGYPGEKVGGFDWDRTVEIA